MQDIFVVQQGEGDDTCLLVKTKKQAKAPTNLSTMPVSKSWPHNVALPVFTSAWVAWDHLEDQFR
jgi:hypothetical protein